ncbi:hypothetical protein uvFWCGRAMDCOMC455_010 [Freshwater phage uvFW-CGR-AMD-COM-C455]|jgi:hypothetical protein|nr:hypothetical protein uvFWCGRAMDCOMC455_010 [Freshwater phage uvFW-CGR-AMD-COM-C455]
MNEPEWDKLIDADYKEYLGERQPTEEEIEDFLIVNDRGES